MILFYLRGNAYICAQLMNIESKQEKHEFQETNKFPLWSTAADRQFVGSKRMCIHSENLFGAFGS